MPKSEMTAWERAQRDELIVISAVAIVVGLVIWGFATDVAGYRVCA